MGMGTSLEGTQASREGESHSQEANVAEADMVKHSMPNLRTPITIETPTAINWVWRRTGFNYFLTPCPATRACCCESSVTGAMKSMQHRRLVSSAVRCVKGSEGHLSRRINCYVSNAGTIYRSLRGRSADDQYGRWGSKAVVVDGVTTIQGERIKALAGRRAYSH